MLDDMLFLRLGLAFACASGTAGMAEDALPPTVSLLDIVCHPTADIPVAHRLAVLTGPGAAAARVRTSVAGETIENAVVGRIGDAAVIAIPDVSTAALAVIAIAGGPSVSVETGPARGFEIYLMPSSHLCFGYNTCLPEHIEAGRVVSAAIEHLRQHPDYRWNIEFARGAKKLVDSYPELAPDAQRFRAQGRLSIGPFWTPSSFEQYDAEAEVRQLVHSQWWLRENFGGTSRAALGHDSMGYDPQQPQVFKQAGIDFFWRCRYTLREKRFGSPYLSHVGVDGTRLPCFTSRPPLGSGYIWSPIGALGWGTKADRSDPNAFGSLVAATAEYMGNTREICGADVNFNFTGNDQGHPDEFGETEKAAAWNRLFRTPSVRLATVEESMERLLNSDTFKQDDQEPEQPCWALVGVTMSRLMLPFQEASYALCAAEKAAAIDYAINGAAYPRDELEVAWTNILDEQHHEQLGFGVEDQLIYAGSKLDRSLAVAHSITQAAALRTASRIGFRRNERAVVAFNFLNWARTDIVEVEGLGGDACVLDPTGEPVPFEVTGSGSLRFLANADGMGYSTYYVGRSETATGAAADLAARSAEIENEYYRLTVDPATGCALKLVDKELGTTLADNRGDRLPFELVVNEDTGTGYCGFLPTGRLWRAADFPEAKVTTEVTGLAARVVVERPLLATAGEARVGSGMRIVYELPTKMKRLDVKVEVDWDSEPKREFRMFLPFAAESPAISYDTLFATSDYDPELAKRQDLWLPELENNSFKAFTLIDARTATRFVSAYDAAADVSVTVSAPHRLLRVEHGGVSFTLIEDRTDDYWNGMMSNQKGRHVFHTSLTSSRGDWKANKAWRFGWERCGGFNPLVAVVPVRMYAVLPERGRMIDIGGENLVLTALKLSHSGRDLVARVYDAAGAGDRLGVKLTAPYMGFVPSRTAFAKRTGDAGGNFGTDAIKSKGSGATASSAELRPLRFTGAFEANLLEDQQRKIDVDELCAGAVPVKPHGIFTARIEMEMLDHSWEAAFGKAKE